MLKKKLLLIALLIVGCENPTETFEIISAKWKEVTILIGG